MFHSLNSTHSSRIREMVRFFFLFSMENMLWVLISTYYSLFWALLIDTHNICFHEAPLNSTHDKCFPGITRNMSTVHGCPRYWVPDYKTAKFYLVQMPSPESNRMTYVHYTVSEEGKPRSKC